MDPQMDPMWQREQRAKDRNALLVMLVVIILLALAVGTCVYLMPKVEVV